jgi:hypothetical protein
VTLTIDKRQFILSERRASDALDMAYAAGKKTEPDAIDNVLMLAQVVKDSLKATYLALGFLRGYYYRRFVGDDGVSNLLDACTTRQLADAFIYITEELEGSKKKAPRPVPNVSAEMSAEVSLPSSLESLSTK